MNEEVTLGQLLELMTIGTRVKIMRDSDVIYIGMALDAFNTSSSETLSEEVMSVTSTKENTQLIRL